MSAYSLEGQIAVVAGASSGNGKGIALELARFGMDVQCIARREEKLQELVKEIEAAGGKASYYIADTNETETVQAVFGQIIDTKGKIDLLVNNVGQNNVIGLTWECDLDAMWKEIEVNNKGLVTATALGVTQMIKQKGGRIINVGGGGTVKPHVFSSAYSASKASIARFTETVALELTSIDSPVKVFTFGPGLVINERTIELANSEECAKFWPNIVDLVNNGKCSTPQQIGEFVGFIASGALDNYHGKIISFTQDKEKVLNNAERALEADAFTLRMK